MGRIEMTNPNALGLWRVELDLNETKNTIRVLESRDSWDQFVLDNCSDYCDVTLVYAMLRAHRVHILGHALSNSNVCLYALGMGLVTANNLVELCLSTVDVSESTASALTLGLKGTDCLKILIFQRCRLSDQVIKLLAKGLEDNATLRQLEVDKCQFTHELHQHDHEGFIQILASMNHHPSLINLKAVGIVWTASSMQALSALTKRQQLKHLDLNCCMETPNEPSESGRRQHLAPIISLLPSNLSLQTLILSSNNLGDDMVSRLVDALAVNSILQELHLQQNRITDKGLGILAACLPHMKLHTLLLSGNMYNKEASEQILLSLPQNTTLQVMHLYTTLRVSRRITYYLNLNQAGRRLHARPNVPASLWPLVLARINRLWASDIMRKEMRASGIYGMLQEHPGVFMS
jgi:hypothetical protein